MPHVDLVEGVTHPDGWPAAVVRTAWNEKPLVKQVPGARFRPPPAEYWVVPLTWASYVQLRGIFPHATYSDTYLAWVQHTFETLVRPARLLRNLLTFDLATFDPRLRDYQNAAVAWARLVRCGVVGDEMGLGKTIELLLIMRYLERSLPALVACPNSVKEHWAARVPDWFPEATPYVVDGPAARRQKTIEAARLDPSALVIINLEAARLFSRLAPYGSVKLVRCRECDPRYGDDVTPSRCHVHPKALNGFGFRTVVVDEVHRIAAPSSQQTRALWALGRDPSVVYRWGTTGTFIRNNPMDLWSAMHFVAPDEYPVKGAFGERYALQAWNPHGGTDVVGVRPDTRDELFAFLDWRYRRMLKAVVARQLPPKVYSTRYVDLSRGQRKMYAELHEEQTTADAAGQAIVTLDPLVTRTRKAQLSVASLVVVEKPDEDDPTTWRLALAEPSPVLDELERVLDELDGAQVAVAAVSKQLIDLAARRLMDRGVQYGLITGDVTPAQRATFLREFHAGRLQVMLFTVQAGGTGVDMSCAPNVVFIQQPDSMIDYLQAEDRVHRIGSEDHESVHVIRIVARDTVEADKENQLREKLARLEEINRDRAVLAAVAGRDADLAALEEEHQKIMNSWTTDAPTGQEET